MSNLMNANRVDPACIALLDRARRRIEKGKLRYGDRVIFSTDVMLIVEMMATILSLQKAARHYNDAKKLL